MSWFEDFLALFVLATVTVLGFVGLLYGLQWLWRALV